MKSWQTSASAIIAAVIIVLTAGQALLDGNPETSPNWNLVVTEIVLAIGLLRARDNNKTSEDVGVKGQSKNPYIP